MKRHLGIALIGVSVFVFFMAQAQAKDGGVFFAKPTLTTMLSNRCVDIMDVVSRIPAYIRLFLNMPALNFKLQDVGFGTIENTKQIEQSV